MRLLLCFLFVIISGASFGQQRSILVFDLMTGDLDSITNVTFDTMISSDLTPFYEGGSTSGIAPLDMQSPTTNIFPGTSFSQVSATGATYNNNQFPISSSVRISRIEDGIDQANCSGSLISKRHVLSAAHCFASFTSVNDSLVVDSLRVSPAYDQGQEHPVFGASLVRKVYIIRDWQFNGDDFAILELEEPLGEQAGWISIGFDKSEAALVGHHYYKFSYPANTSEGFNGDTMYTNYGAISYATGPFIGIVGATGYSGQSGSSLIHTENGQTYTTYGTTTFALHFRHCYIKNWHFYSFLEIIEDDLLQLSETEQVALQVYPNPTQDFVHIQGNSAINRVEVLSVSGQTLGVYENDTTIDMTSFQPGTYLLAIYHDGGNALEKIVKY